GSARHRSSSLFPYTTLFRSGGETSLAEGLRRVSAYARARGVIDGLRLPWPARLASVAAAAARTPSGAGGRDPRPARGGAAGHRGDRKSTRLNSSHLGISYAV